MVAILLTYFPARVKADTEMAKVIEAALMTERLFTADILAQTDQQGMVFIEQPGIGWQIFHKKCLVGSIAATIRGETNAVDDTAGISIDNENWLAGSIQYYGVSRLLSDAMNGKKLSAQAVNTISKKFIQIVVEVFAKPVSEGL